MGKEDKIGNEAFQWVRAKVFNYNKTSVGRAMAFGCATRCHLSLHSLVMPRSDPDDASHGGGGGWRGFGGGRGGGGRGGVPTPAVAAASVLHSAAVGGSVAGDVGAF